MINQKVLNNSFNLIQTKSADDSEAINKLSSLATELTGVQFSSRHSSMISSRIKKRMIELELESLSDYLNFLLENTTSEIPKFINLITTHHTYFFREFKQFEYLLQKILPELDESAGHKSKRTLRIWSAACSKGHEAYSIAMFLETYLSKFSGFDNYEILATDIDGQSIAFAKNGVYHRNEIKEIPLALLGDHWTKGTGVVSDFVKVKNSLRSKINFDTLNLMDISTSKLLGQKFDLIFCRNVFIYFNGEQIKNITNDLISKLNLNGYLFLGLSESITNYQLPISNAGPSIYKINSCNEEFKSIHLKSSKFNTDLQAPIKALIKTNLEPSQSMIRVFCVDDSPTILALLKKILSPEHGFEIIGTAKNGIEANKQLKFIKPDIVTLDIHMPEQTGIEYLQKNYSVAHPPVVMISSVSRENADLAGMALKLGASDYIEKPALSNLQERGEEIRTKIRCSLQFREISKLNLTLDQSFQRKFNIVNCANKLRIIIIPLSSRSHLKKLFNELSGTQPGTLILIDCSDDTLASFAELLSSEINNEIKLVTNLDFKILPNNYYIGSYNFLINKILLHFPNPKDISILVYGEVSIINARYLYQFKDSQIILEDLGSGYSNVDLLTFASEVVAPSSFAYISSEYFSKR